MRKRNPLDLRKIHLRILFGGMILTILPLFHENLWFDEAYTAALSGQPFSDIISIGVHDVHPLLYYFLLHPLTLLFKDPILSERLFSWVCLCLSAWFGWQVIAKTYGEKTGLLFSFFVFFFPPDIVYAGEMRMYMLVFFLVTVCAYETERLLTAPSRKHCILFTLFAIASAWTHYYGLLAAGILDLILLARAVQERICKKKGKALQIWLMMAGVEILSYLPWFAVLLKQSGAVSQNFWIEWKWPDSLFDMFLFFFTGNLEKTVYVPVIAGVVFAAVFLYILVRCGRRSRPALLYLAVWAGAILAGGLASLVLHRTVLYPRYLLVCHGCILLAFSLILAKIPQREACILGTGCLAMTCLACISLCSINYDPSNQKMFDLLQEEMEPQDTILLSNYGQDPNSFTALPRISHDHVIYWNELGWNEESVKAYAAFGDMQVCDHPDLSDVHGRLWVLYGNDDAIGMPVGHVREEVERQWERKPLATWYFPTAYKDIEYSLALFQRD